MRPSACLSRFSVRISRGPSGERSSQRSAALQARGARLINPRYPWRITALKRGAANANASTTRAPASPCEALHAATARPLAIASVSTLPKVSVQARVNIDVGRRVMPREIKPVKMKSGGARAPFQTESLRLARRLKLPGVHSRSHPAVTRSSCWPRSRVSDTSARGRKLIGPAPYRGRRNSRTIPSPSRVSFVCDLWRLKKFQGIALTTDQCRVVFAAFGTISTNLYRSRVPPRSLRRLSTPDEFRAGEHPPFL